MENFRIAAYRFAIVAGKEGLELPPFKGSTFRGGFGAAFKKIACSQQGRKKCTGCLLQNTCPYAYVFETSPPPGAEVLKNYDDIPRPFVIEPPPERKTSYTAGEELQFDVLLMGNSIEYLPYFIVAFEKLGEMGIGKGRRKYNIKEIAAVNPLTTQEEIIYTSEIPLVKNIDLSVSGKDVLKNTLKNISQIELKLITPLRLKYQRQMVNNLQFHILMRNILRRVSSILYFHHDKELELDYAAVIEEAEKVDKVEDNTTWVDWERFSRRQDMKLRMGGLVGKVKFQGELDKFYPYLKLAELIHAGKGTVFGLGKFQIMTENVNVKSII